MKFIGVRLEVLISVFFLMIFQGIFWPPNSFFADPTMPLDASDPYSSSASAALLGFLAIAKFARREEMWELVRPAWPILALVGLAFVSAFWSEAPYLVLRRSTTLTGTTLLGIYLAARFDMARLVAILVKISAFAAVASFVVMATLPKFGFQGGVDYPTAWRAAYTSKNTLGLMSAVGIIIAIYALWNGYGPRLLAAAVIPANLVLLHFSQSGTPTMMLMGAFYAAAVLIAFRRRDGLGLIAGFVLVLIALAGIALLALDWTEVLTALNRSPTLTGRDRIWRIVVDMIGRRPWLGYGYEAFWRHDGAEANLVWSVLKWPVPHAHNMWLEVGLSLGIVGIAALALLWLAAFYRGLRILTLPQARHVAFIMTLIVAILVENQTEYEFLRQNAFLWVFFVTLFVHLGRDVLRYRAGPAGAAQPRPRRPVPAIAYPGARSP